MKIIFLVDDDITNLKVGKEALSGSFDVLTFISGEELLEALKTMIPDMILLDLNMPIMNGYQTMLRLKANDLWKNIPVIILTAINKKEAMERGISLGAVGYVTKPFSTKDLLSRVNTYFNAR